MSVGALEIRRAGLADLDLLIPLFDVYRQFYRQPSEPERARQFLSDRIKRCESVVFLALTGDDALGFAQLYPSFSSGALARIWILNDVFVSQSARRRGIGTALLGACARYGREMGAARLVLSTEINNRVAQSVYERNGWEPDTTFRVYTLKL